MTPRATSDQRPATGAPSARRIVVGMSGGVDSSVAAALLVDAGYQVIGVSMRLWEAEAGAAASGCCTLDDFLDARLVAAQLGIPFYVMDFRAAFAATVVDDFVAEYRRGRTPNPCARCNQFVKFAALWERARELGAESIATGHYARVREGAGGAELLSGVDAQKDQSYYLFGIDPAVLARVRFPLGAMTKAAVRAEAARRGLPVAAKPDSQEICFAPRGRYAELVERRPSAEPLRGGVVADGAGRVLGTHDGVHRFTVGQRRGLGGGADAARFVTDIDAGSGTVRVGGAAELGALGLEARAANWLGPVAAVGARLRVKIRSRFAPQPVRVAAADAGSFSLAADEPLRAVTPGQAAVLYDGARVVGGGWIARALREGPGSDPRPSPPADTAEGRVRS